MSMDRIRTTEGARTGARTLAALAMLLVAVAAEPGPVSGQESAAATVFGRYTLDEPVSRVQTRIGRATDRSIADMNGLIRGLARMRLADYTPIVYNLRLAARGDAISISIDGHTLRCNADGSPRDVTTPTGDDAQLTCRLAGTRLTQSYVFDQGTRRHVFTLRPEGKLVMQVSMGSEQLPAPLSYAMRYRRSRR
jgi:hypothetical protein